MGAVMKRNAEALKPTRSLTMVGYFETEDYVALTFSPHLLKTRGVSSAYVDGHGQLHLTIEVDRKTPAQMKKAQADRSAQIDKLMGAMTVKGAVR